MHYVARMLLPNHLIEILNPSTNRFIAARSCKCMIFPCRQNTKYKMLQFPFRQITKPSAQSSTVGSNCKVFLQYKIYTYDVD